MAFAIKGPLTSRKGNRVRFGAPGDVRRRGGDDATYGVIEDEVWADPAINDSPFRSCEGKDDWGDYSFFAQLIRWDDGERHIRLGYYRRRSGEDEWKFAGQTTVSSTCATIQSLLEKTLARKDWFVKRRLRKAL